MRRRRSGAFSFGVLALQLATSVAFAQQTPPTIRAGVLNGAIRVDGVLDEAAWSSAETIDTFLQTDPEEGKPATERTIVRVLAAPDALIFGIKCESRDLVEERKLIDESTYNLSIALAQIMPGPLAAQTAMAIGYFRAGIAGATSDWHSFCRPS